MRFIYSCFQKKKQLSEKLRCTFGSSQTVHVPPTFISLSFPSIHTFSDWEGFLSSQYTHFDPHQEILLKAKAEHIPS